MACTIHRVDPEIPVLTPKGKARAIFLLDYSEEDHLFWVCVQDDSGEVWTFPNPLVRVQSNPSLGRIFSRAAMASGRVKFFNQDKGWGFLANDAGGPDIFLHISDLNACGITALKEGQRLSFEPVPGRNGKGPKAANLALRT
jgi:CspA family cold shock protein